jgi:hypothetical protein
MRRWIDILTETMTRQEASAIFSRYGVPGADRMDVKTLRAERNKLAKTHHSDVGGDDSVIKTINAAYDVLKAPVQSAAPPRPSTQEEPPVWSRAGYSGGIPDSGHISKQDYSDKNFVKKKMWELSGKSTEEWTIWNFDGTYFRGTITVYGNERIFPEMASAMRQWDRFFKSRAVFVSKKNDRTLYLIWSDGEDRHPPIPFEHDSFNANPSNDSMFMYELPKHLNQIRAEHDSQEHDDGFTIPKPPN